MELSARITAGNQPHRSDKLLPPPKMSPFEAWEKKTGDTYYRCLQYSCGFGGETDSILKSLIVPYDLCECVRVRIRVVKDYRSRLIICFLFFHL